MPPAFSLRSVIIKTGIALVVVFCLWKVFLFLESDEQKIRRLVFDAKAAVEKEDLFKTISYVSLRYDDEAGMSRASLFGLARHIFRRYSTIKIEITDAAITVVDREHATVDVSCIGQGRRSREKAVIPALDTERVSVTAYLHREDRRWLITRLEFHEPQHLMQILEVL